MNETIKTQSVLTDITPNPINDEIYSQTDLSDLILSLETHGQLEPIVVNTSKVIISGHRRYFSMMQLGWTECDIRVSELDNDIVALIEFNRSRIKSVNDILNESRILERELKKEIGRGRTATQQRSGKKMDVIIEVSRKLGLGATKLKMIKSIANYEPSLLTQIDNDEMSVNKAYEIIKSKYINTTSVDDKEQFSRKLSKLLKEYQPSNDEIEVVMSKTYPYSVSNLPQGEEKRDDLLNHLINLKRLDEREIVQYRKYRELQSLSPSQKLVDELEQQLWSPTDINNKEQTIKEIENIRPVIELSNGEEFDILRVKIHSMEWVRNPGRLIQIIIKNESDNKLLGILTIASDMLSVENRDSFIGWDEQERLRGLKHLAVVSTCVATQPFGFNFLGSKLIASLSSSKVVRDFWKEKYGDTLVGLTTTSLFGQFSMYNSIPTWKSLGETKGTVLLKPDSSHYNFWRDWVKENFQEEYEHATGHSSPKQNVLNLIFKYLNIDKKQFMSEHRKGLYFSNIYENGLEFLCDEISEDDLIVNDKFERDVLDWWIPKAIKRYSKLYDENRLDENSLWYDNLDKKTMQSWFSSRGIDEIL
jgi:hypothetical protein